jgi:hypothetical protein
VPRDSSEARTGIVFSRLKRDRPRLITLGLEFELALSPLQADAIIDRKWYKKEMDRALVAALPDALNTLLGSDCLRRYRKN